jgi:hypothetical protein
MVMPEYNNTMWIIIYHCPECDSDFGSTAEFSHDHCFEEPEVIIEERLCSRCTARENDSAGK